MNFEQYFKKKYKEFIDDKVACYIKNDNFDTSIKSLYIENDSELSMIVYATVYVDYYSFYDNEERQCLTVKCFVDLEDTNKFKVLEIVDWEKTNICNYSLNSNSLLPYIKNTKYEEIADEILQKYFSKEELLDYVNPKLLAKKMGLEVKYYDLPCDYNVFGMICFRDCYIKIMENEEIVEKHVEKGTIIVNKRIYSNIGYFCSDNFTIMHECVHWYLHRKYFYLESECLNLLSCSDDKVITDIESFKEDFKYMEYQANGIAAKLLLPYYKVKKDFKNLYDSLIISNSVVKVYEMIIDNIAMKANASKEAVKIRLLELGYKVDGIFEYLEGRYIKSYLYSKEKNENESYTIEEFDFLKLLIISSDFFEFTKNYNYKYIDGHLVADNKKYITSDNQLTTYALENIDECCVLFKYRFQNTNTNISKNRHLLFRANSKGRTFFIDSFVFPDELFSNEKYLLDDENKKVNKMLNAIKDMDIHSALRECREALSISQYELSIRSNYNERTIRDIETGTKKRISIENILRISLGLKLRKEIIYKLLEIAGLSIENRNNHQHVLYKFIIDHKANASNESIDLFLINNKQNPLFYDKSEYENK